VRSDARFSYRFSVNDSLVPSEEEKDPGKREARFQRDPLNRRHVNGPTSDSLIELPDAPAQPWFQPRNGVPTGKLTTIPFRSRILGNERTLTIYTPPGYDPAGRPYRLLILMDAESQEEMAWERYGIVMERVAATAKLPLRFYLDVGKFENNFHPSPLTANRHLRDVLIAKGYDLKTRSSPDITAP
jgi:enterochelin esterase-like enzyme